MTDTQRKINKAVIEKNGEDAQVRQLAEEMSELFVEVNKAMRRRADASVDHIAEEIADVRIMLDQMIVLFDIPTDTLRRWKTFKYQRLFERTYRDE